MEEKNKEFTLAQEHAAPPPECAALPPEAPAAGHRPSRRGLRRGKCRRAEKRRPPSGKRSPLCWWPVGHDGGGRHRRRHSGGSRPATPDTPPIQQEPYVPPEPEPEPLTGVLHYTIYNDTFDDSGVPLILAEGTVDMATLSDTPRRCPQPETPSNGGYAFLGWASRYDTAGGKVWTTVPDPPDSGLRGVHQTRRYRERSIVLPRRLAADRAEPLSLVPDPGRRRHCRHL